MEVGAKVISEESSGPVARAEGTRYTLEYGQYRLSYEVYGSGDRVLVWVHGLLLDANLSRGLPGGWPPRATASC